MSEYLHRGLTEEIIGAAMEVHRQLGPGFLEGVYEEALIYELTTAGLVCEKQKEFIIRYKDVVLAKKLRCDLVVEGKVIVENKSVSEIGIIDEVQLVSYLKASKLQVGLLFNFGKKSLQFKRRILTMRKSAESA
jgi:GxxExxY protein